MLTALEPLKIISSDEIISYLKEKGHTWGNPVDYGNLFKESLQALITLFESQEQIEPALNALTLGLTTRPIISDEIPEFVANDKATLRAPKSPDTSTVSDNNSRITHRDAYGTLAPLLNIPSETTDFYLEKNLTKLLNHLASTTDFYRELKGLTYHVWFHMAEFARDWLVIMGLEDAEKAGIRPYRLIGFLAVLFHDIVFKQYRCKDETESAQYLVEVMAPFFNSIKDPLQKMAYQKVISALINLLIMAGTTPIFVNKKEGAGKFPTHALTVWHLLFEFLEEKLPDIKSNPLKSKLRRLCEMMSDLDVMRTTIPCLVAGSQRKDLHNEKEFTTILSKIVGGDQATLARMKARLGQSFRFSLEGTGNPCKLIKVKGLDEIEVAKNVGSYILLESTDQVAKLFYVQTPSELKSLEVKDIERLQNEVSAMRSVKGIKEDNKELLLTGVEAHYLITLNTGHTKNVRIDTRRKFATLQTTPQDKMILDTADYEGIIALIDSEIEFAEIFKTEVLETKDKSTRHYELDFESLDNYANVLRALKAEALADPGKKIIIADFLFHNAAAQDGIYFDYRRLKELLSSQVLEATLATSYPWTFSSYLLPLAAVTSGATTLPRSDSDNEKTLKRHGLLRDDLAARHAGGERPQFVTRGGVPVYLDTSSSDSPTASPTRGSSALFRTTLPPLDDHHRKPTKLSSIRAHRAQLSGYSSNRPGPFSTNYDERTSLSHIAPSFGRK